MKFKYLFMSVGVIIFTFLFSQKVSAIDIGYCSYGDLKLTLPVTIKVNLEGINMAYPFDENKKLEFSAYPAKMVQNYYFFFKYTKILQKKW